LSRGKINVFTLAVKTDSKCRDFLNCQTYILYNFRVKTTQIKVPFKIAFSGSFETYINPQTWEGYSILKEQDEKETAHQDYWNSGLSSFHKLILIKCCKEEKVGFFLIKGLGYQYFY
jgi:hypothetical protein